MEVMFMKSREVKTPFRANKNDAGIDFFLPVMDERMVQDVITKNPGNQCIAVKEGEAPYIIVRPGSRVLIPTGIHTNIFPKNSAFIAFNKSGLSANHGIIVTAQVVDSDYTGEIHVGILNTSNEYKEFHQGDKIGQFVHIPVFLTNMKEITPEVYQELTSNSDRGQGGFGSSDK